MARIPEQEIERIKQEVSVQRLAEALGIELHRHGADLIRREGEAGGQGLGRTAQQGAMARQGQAAGRCCDRSD